MASTEPSLAGTDGLEDVLALHARQIDAFGGALGIRDLGLLESAVAMPSATFGGQIVHEGLFLMAAAYAFHLAENQPFLDGNKRTGLGAALAHPRSAARSAGWRSSLLVAELVRAEEDHLQVLARGVVLVDVRADVGAGELAVPAPTEGSATARPRRFEPLARGFEGRWVAPS